MNTSRRKPVSFETLGAKVGTRLDDAGVQLGAARNRLVKKWRDLQNAVVSLDAEIEDPASRVASAASELLDEARSTSADLVAQLSGQPRKRTWRAKLLSALGR